MISARKRFGRRWPLGVVLATVALGLSSARADDDHARELFKQGTVYFDLSQYDRAIEVWQRGYEEKQDPGFLYNIAQAYRLWGNAEKAITFYKSFLRNSPKAENRAEIEEKITALQTQLAEGGGRTPPPGGAAPPPPGTAANGGRVAPRAEATPPPPVSQVAAGRSAAPAADVGATNGVPVAPPPSRGRFELGAEAGGSFWLSGAQGSPQPAFALAVRGGANLASHPDATVAFRLGGAVGYSLLSDPEGRTSFVSILAEPGVRIRLATERWFLHTGVGIGVVVVAGLKPQSPLLVRDRRLAVDGTQSLLELRPRAELECRLSPAIAVSLGPALAYSPQRTYYYDQWLRLQLMVAFTFRI